MSEAVIGPRQDGNDLPDSALSIIEMLEGKVMEFDRSFAREGKVEVEEFGGWLKSIIHKANLAQDIVFIDGLQEMIRKATETPEQRLMKQLDDILVIAKGEGDLIDVEKTNLPPIDPPEDSVSELTDEEKNSKD